MDTDDDKPDAKPTLLERFTAFLTREPEDREELKDLLRGAFGDDAAFADDDRRLTEVLAARGGDAKGFFGRVGGDWSELRRGLFGERFALEALLALVPPLVLELLAWQVVACFPETFVRLGFVWLPTPAIYGFGCTALWLHDQKRQRWFSVHLW
jgi:hypothetical protein